MSKPRKERVRRAPKSISPKVSVPSAITGAVAVAWALIDGQVVDTEQILLAAVALAQFVIGYVKSDKLDPADEIV